MRYPRADLVEIGYYELSTHLIALALMERGYRVRWLNKGLLLTEIENEAIGFWCTRSNANSVVGAKSARRKDVARDLLHARGVSIASGKVFSDAESAASWVRSVGDAVVVKPIADQKGRGVTVGVEDVDQLRIAWSRACRSRSNARVLIEKQFQGGSEARFLVVGSQCVAVFGMRPPSVIGDGRSTIGQLVEAKNEARLRNPHLRNRLIRIDEERTCELLRAGFTLNDVPAEGRHVFLDLNANPSVGGDTIDLTTEVHPSMKEAALTAAAAFPGLNIAGVDLIAKDFRSPATPDSYIVVEVNSMPALGGHHFPWEGESRDAAGAIVDWFEQRRGRSLGEPPDTRTARRRGVPSHSRHPRVDRMELGFYELSTHLLALELMRRGYQVRWLHRSFLLTEIGEETIGFWCTRSNANASVAVKAAVRKDIARKILVAAGLSVAPGRVFRELESVAQWARSIGQPIVIKPIGGQKGRGITVGILDDDQLKIAWDAAQGSRRRRRVLAEEVFNGGEARFLIVGGRCMAVLGKRPPTIVGTGRSTIAELIATKNEARSRNPHLRSRLIDVTGHRLERLSRKGLTPNDVLPEGVELVLDLNASLSGGGDSIGLTDDVHPTFKELAIAAVAAFPGLNIAGVDLIAKDLRLPASTDNYIVVEVNSMPALGGHHFPWEGEPRDAAGAIIDWFEERGVDPRSADPKPVGARRRRRRWLF